MSCTSSCGDAEVLFGMLQTCEENWAAVTSCSFHLIQLINKQIIFKAMSQEEGLKVQWWSSDDAEGCRFNPWHRPVTLGYSLRENQ